MSKELIKVRILDNGMAREVNPKGKEPDPDKYQDKVQWSFDHNAWQLAGSECRIFPWEVAGGKMYAPETQDHEWYAYIDNKTFMLIKPALSE